MRNGSVIREKWIDRALKKSGHMQYPDISLQELEKNQVLTLKIAGNVFDIWNRDPWNTMQDYLFLDVNIRRRCEYSTSILKIYRIIQ